MGVWLLKPGSFKVLSSLRKLLVTFCINGVAVQVYAQFEIEKNREIKPPPLLTHRIIADLRSGDECADPDYPGLRVRRTGVFLPLPGQ